MRRRLFAHPTGWQSISSGWLPAASWKHAWKCTQALQSYRFDAENKRHARLHLSRGPLSLWVCVSGLSSANGLNSPAIWIQKFLDERSSLIAQKLHQTAKETCVIFPWKIFPINDKFPLKLHQRSWEILPRHLIDASTKSASLELCPLEGTAKRRNSERKPRVKWHKGCRGATTKPPPPTTYKAGGATTHKRCIQVCRIEFTGWMHVKRNCKGFFPRHTSTPAEAPPPGRPQGHRIVINGSLIILPQDLRQG